MHTLNIYNVDTPFFEIFGAWLSFFGRGDGTEDGWRGRTERRAYRELFFVLGCTRSPSSVLLLGMCLFWSGVWNFMRLESVDNMTVVSGRGTVV